MIAVDLHGARRAAVREQPVDQQPDLVGGPLAHRRRRQLWIERRRRRTPRARYWCCRRRSLEHGHSDRGITTTSPLPRRSARSIGRCCTSSAPHASMPAVTPVTLRRRRRPRHARARRRRRAARHASRIASNAARPADRRSAARAPRASRRARSPRSTARPSSDSSDVARSREVRRIRRRADVDAVADDDVDAPCMPDASARMPAELPAADVADRSATSSPAWRPVAAAMPRRARRRPRASAASWRGRRRRARPGVRTTETYSPLPGGENHVRPRRPRPAVCCVGDDHGAFGRRDPRCAATSLVDPVVVEEHECGDPSRPRRGRGVERCAVGEFAAGSAESDRLDLKADVDRRRGMRERARPTRNPRRSPQAPGSARA